MKRELYQELAVYSMQIFFDKCNLLAEKVIAAHPEFNQMWNGKLADYRSYILSNLKVSNARSLVDCLQMIRYYDNFLDPSCSNEPPDEYWWIWLVEAVSDINGIIERRLLRG